jgi:hypothetical protein
MSPLRKTAPIARPVRRKGDQCRQVSWLAGRHPRSAFPGLATVPDDQVRGLGHAPSGIVKRGLTADSCGGSSGFGPKRDAGRSGFPLGRPLTTGTPAPMRSEDRCINFVNLACRLVMT